jgi:hypothetical protein
MSICDATTLDRIRRPSTTTAAAVSSHDDSIPRIRTSVRPVSLIFSRNSHASTQPRFGMLTAIQLVCVPRVPSPCGPGFACGVNLHRSTPEFQSTHKKEGGPWALPRRMQVRCVRETRLEPHAQTKLHLPRCVHLPFQGSEVALVSQQIVRVGQLWVVEDVVHVPGEFS